MAALDENSTLQK